MVVKDVNMGRTWILLLGTHGAPGESKGRYTDTHWAPVSEGHHTGTWEIITRRIRHDAFCHGMLGTKKMARQNITTPGAKKVNDKNLIQNLGVKGNGP